MTKKKILLIILLVLILCALALAGLIARELYTDWQSRSFYSNMLNDVGTRGSVHEPEHTDEDEEADDEEGLANPESVATSYGEWVPYVDFRALNYDFPGIVGWIKLDDTLLNYPVMQYHDNNYFLTHLPDGTEHRSGSIFLDYRNSPDFSDKNMLIYGHESRVDDMFGALKNYRKQAFYNANPIMHLYTPEHDYLIIPFAAYLAHPVLDHPIMEFSSDEAFLAYINNLKSISFIRTNVDVSAEDRIVSLVTCAYDFNNARLIVVGIIVET